MKQKEFDELVKLHQKIRPADKVRLTRLYRENVSAKGKDALLTVFRETYPKLWEAVAAVKKRVVGGRATVTAQRLFIVINGRAPVCPSCKEAHVSCIKQDRPVDMGRACDSYKCKCDFRRQSTTLGALKKFGVTNVFATRQFKENRVRFLQDKYGDEVTAPLLVPGAAQKVRATSLARYGVTHFARAKSVRAARAATCVARFGATSFLVTEEAKDKRRSAFLTKYGIAADHPTQVPSIEARRQQSMQRFSGDQQRVRAAAEKRARTCIEKYGVPNPTQDPVIHAKNQKFRSKVGVWRGKPCVYQGDELKVLRSLETRNNVKDATTEKKHRIKYKFKGKDRWYFPDIEVLKRDGTLCIIEVKSVWTLRCYLRQNITKFKAAERYAATIGAEFIVAVTNEKGIAWAKNPSHKLVTRLRQAGVRW